MRPASRERARTRVVAVAARAGPDRRGLRIGRQLRRPLDRPPMGPSARGARPRRGRGTCPRRAARQGTRLPVAPLAAGFPGVAVVAATQRGEGDGGHLAVIRAIARPRTGLYRLRDKALPVVW